MSNRPKPTADYPQHVRRLQEIYSSALNEAGADADGILLHSGNSQVYFGDDSEVPFQAFGHFCHWLPVNRPDQFLLIEPGKTPAYLQVIADDFWHEHDVPMADWWASHYEVTRLQQSKEIGQYLAGKHLHYLGPQPGLAQYLGFEQDRINSAGLSSWLDYRRAIKSDYEVEQIRQANRLALNGHEAARNCFLAGGSEYDIHLAFLQACNILEEESPYTNIVALNEKAAILHYQNKRRQPPEKSQVLLIDAGCRINNYASDITRTHTTTPSVFCALVENMNTLQLDIIRQLRPGLAYGDLHLQALSGIATLLHEHRLCHADPEEQLQRKIPQLFMPHGVGHLLGVQVHDVGGRQTDNQGKIKEPPEHSPSLRTTRDMETNMVVTIEPGLYFIPLLLEPERGTPRGDLPNWALIDELYACGGVRIEDNVRVTEGEAENLTRQFESV